MIDRSICCCYLYCISRYGYPPPAEHTERYLEEMAALGFRTVELEGIRREHLNAVYERRFTIKEKIDSLGLSVPYFCVVLPGLASADADIRKEQLALFEKGCEIASLLGSRGVLDNGPVPPYHFPEDIPVVRHYDADVVLAARFPPGLHWPRYWDAMVGTFRDACDIAASRGLTYLMHPAIGVLCSTTDSFLYFRDAVQKENLRFNFDTANQFAMKENLPLALHRLKGSVDYIHLSDNRGHRVEHLPVGSGAIRWESFFEALNEIRFEGTIGLDIGGEESEVQDLDAAYVNTARWLEQHWKRYAALPS